MVSPIHQDKNIRCIRNELYPFACHEMIPNTVCKNHENTFVVAAFACKHDIVASLICSNPKNYKEALYFLLVANCFGIGCTHQSHSKFIQDF